MDEIKESREEELGTPESLDGLPREEIDWSNVIRPVPLYLSGGSDLAEAIENDVQNEEFKYLLTEYDIKKIIVFDSGKIYNRDSKGFFTIITAIKEDSYLCGRHRRHDC